MGQMLALQSGPPESASAHAMTSKQAMGEVALQGAVKSN
jgi:hypothetical protein